MSNEVATIIEKTDTDITFTRTFDAPRELVFEAFSKPEHIKHWWGRRGWPVTYCTIDFRPGGIWHYGMTNGGGTMVWSKAVYKEIVRPQRVVYVSGFSDAEGGDNDSAAPALSTVQFEEAGEKTTLSVHIQYASAADLEVYVLRGMAEGYTETFEHLSRHLAALKGKGPM